MALVFQRDESHPMLDALLRTRVPRWRELDRTIDERDDMLHFATRTIFEFDFDVSLVNYFQNAIEQLEIVRHVASWRGKPIRRMLDFASGYGRLTRFLVHENVAEEVTVSDILEGGMEFQARQFGVRAILSTTLPEDFVAPGKYDLIFVASLFTHLPPATFVAWLSKLTQLLEPDGVLIFTVHDESIAPESVGDGIKFASFSESRVLDPSDYGSTWVTEGYVREQLAAIDPLLSCVRMPRALSEWQDVYVTSKVPFAHSLPRRPPKGFVEECTIDAQGVHFRGWATLLDEPADRVEVRLEDEIVATTCEFHARPDVAQWQGMPNAEVSGWHCVVPHEAIRSFRYQTVTVSAFSREGIERILFLGTIDSASGFIARQRALARDEQLARRLSEMSELQQRLTSVEHEKTVLQHEIEAMRQSRFWKAREQWFRLKRSAGLTDEQ